MWINEIRPTLQRLSTKAVGALLAFLLLALSAIGATLLLSWQLEGSSAAINETGSLRMHSYRLTLMLSRLVDDVDLGVSRQEVEYELRAMDTIFSLLGQGDPQRPLFLPPERIIHGKFENVTGQWQKAMKPLANAMLQISGADASRKAFWRDYRPQVDGFVQDINNLVHLIEKDSEQRTSWLRGAQFVLVALTLGGAMVLIYLMFLLIVRPVTRLQEGFERIAGRDFGVRLRVDNRDEFGQLTDGFNQMADRLQGEYLSLEQRVQQKTAELEGQNRELALLYECASFLQRQQPVEAVCEGFMQRIMQYFHADGGSVRVLDKNRGNLHMVVHQGISDQLVAAERCLKVGECLCGAAVAAKDTVMHDLRRIDSGIGLQCHKDGFAGILIFHVQAHEQHLGFFNLHFRVVNEFDKDELALLDTLGQLLGVAIQNIRLATREREMAISEERNLVAQGLHDSIAQGLTYLNIQVQMLGDSAAQGRFDEVAEIVPALRAGVQESYEDVRELLLNFRSRLAEGDFVGSLENAVKKYCHQTGMTVNLVADRDGAPFPREQQLQMLFIVQEALSNIRKHAAASRVEIELNDKQDFSLTIHDNGVGFDAEILRQKGESHVGINIMRERAQRIHATFEVVSARGAGTTVSLLLPRERRCAA